LIAASALWQTSEEAGPAIGPKPKDTPVGTPFIRILDHLTLAWGCAMVALEGSKSEVERMLLILLKPKI